MRRPKCEDCRFWAKEEDPNIADPAYAIWSAECRRMPPISLVQPMGSPFPADVPVHKTGWPHTLATHWCGEHQAVSFAPIPPEVLSRPMTSLGLTVRAMNCLAKAGVRNVGDLLKKTDVELYSLINFGDHSMESVKTAVRNLGIDERLYWR